MLDALITWAIKITIPDTTFDIWIENDFCKGILFRLVDALVI